MKPVRLTRIVIVLSTLLVGSVQAAEFKSVGPAAAILYDAPSAKGRKVFVAPRDMPVEVVLSYGAWAKVRDAGGDLSWIESKALAPKRTLVTNVANLKVRSAAEDAAAVSFSADKGVLLELVESTGSGWLRVKHRDGQNGFVKASEVWGE
jgi:SH3-like domain-containing protein